ncbi:HtaA domain-containing protein [Streptomyces fructofermentans]|uniref:HtaA domain-containing protein n=1 Tax=Streptomyces fructofermentans TaxID=152141 RepID=UPI0037A25389
MAANRRRPTALAAACATAVTLGATALAAMPASAAEVPLKGYELTWGIKQSYRAYVTGMAAGAFTPTGGATQAKDNGAFTFADGTGTYDSEGHTVALGFAGSLKISSTLHGFELTLSDVKFDSKAARVTADVTRNGTTSDDVPLAEVTVTRTMTDMPTRLTTQAADVFGSAGYANAAGDPLTVVEKKTQSPSPSATNSTSPSASPSTSTSPSASASPSAGTSANPSHSASTSASPTGAPARGEVTDGTLGWGVKQSFRTYVVDGAAKGRITVSDGATRAAGNGILTFVDATGTYDTEADTLKAAFKGSVNFKGHKENGTYGLDLTLSDLRAEIDGGSGTLTADVDSLGDKSDDVTLAELKPGSADLKAKNDVITLDDVTATLTKAGAEAFGGFYQAGAALDPVDLSVALSEDADLPGTDPGSSTGTSGGTGGTGGAGTTGGAGATGSTTGGVTGGLAATGSDVPAGALGAAAAVTVAAGAGVVLAVRRRRGTESARA